MPEGSISSRPADAEFSTWKFRPNGEQQRIIDYVFFPADGALQPASRWVMPTEAEIGPEALPCAAYPSDHVAQCCEFMWQ